MNRATFCILVLLVLIMQCGLVNQPSAQAQYDSSQFRNATRDLDSATDRLVQAVQIFLQANNRWFPQPKGADMNLCYALHDFKKQVDGIKGKSDRDIRFKLEQMSNNLRGIRSIIKQVGADASVNFQYESVRSALQTLASTYSYTPPWDPMPWNPTPNFNPNFNPFGPQFISARFQPPNYAVVKWKDMLGRIVDVTSAMDSYTISSGPFSRPRSARGDEVQILSAAYAQLREQGGGSGTPINVFTRGHGTFMLAGEAPLNLEQIAISSPKWSQEVHIMVTPRNGQPFQMTGTMNNYNRSGFGVSLQGSGIGVMSGTLQANVSFDNNLYSLYGHGMVNGKPFTLDFDR